MAHFLPWLGPVLAAEAILHQNSGATHTHDGIRHNGTTAPAEMLAAPMPAATAAALLAHDAYRDEAEVYAFALGLHRRQVQLARDAAAAAAAA